MSKSPSQFSRLSSRLIHGGNDPQQQQSYVSPPLYRGSTVLYKNLEELEETNKDPLKLRAPAYGRFGNPNSKDFEALLTELEEGFGTVCAVSGLAAISTALLSFVKTGDHILVSDSVYYPTRRFCESLKRFGVETEFYDPWIDGARIRKLIRSNTKVVYLESPGTFTFEIQDIPSISQVCRELGVVTIADNTWGAALYLRPIQLGANISIHSATKYLIGHADGFLGAIVCDESTYSAVRSCALDLGQKASADEVHLALRGLRTLEVRLSQHDKNARAVAHWLSKRPEVARVLHPALDSHPGHSLWLRDFQGASGLFSFVLREGFEKNSQRDFVNALKLFGIGASWGAYESLILPAFPDPYRKFGDKGLSDRLLRLHIGLEDVDDLILDLEQGFTHLRKSSSQN